MSLDPARPYGLTGEQRTAQRLAGLEREQRAIPPAPTIYDVGTPGAPAFVNGWANLGGAHQAARYWIDRLGIVHLEGTIAAGAVDAPAFTLPAGYRPAALLLFPTITNSGTGRIDIYPSGTVEPTSPSTNGYVPLSGVTFRAET